MTSYTQYMENPPILHGLKTVINLTCKTFSNSIKKAGTNVPATNYFMELLNLLPTRIYSPI